MNVAKMKGKRLEFRTGDGGIGERTVILLQLGSLLSTGNLESEGNGEKSRQGIVFPMLFFYPMPHMSFTDFVVFPPGHGRSVTDF